MNIYRIPEYIKGIIKILYSSINPKKFIYKLSSSDYVIRKIEKYNFYLIVRDNDGPISKSILITGNWEPHICNVLEKYLKNDTVFIDIGANIGFYSLMVASNCKNAKVYSFEPEETNFKVFKANININDLDSKINNFNLAIGDKNEEVFISDFGVNKNSGAKFIVKDKKDVKVYGNNNEVNINKINSVKLDDFLKLEKLDIIKIDIEGFEPYALKGIEKTILNFKPVIFCEFAPSNILDLTKTEPYDFLNYIIELNYTLNVIELNSNIINFDNNTDKLMDYFNLKKTHHIDLLLIPE